MLYQILGEGYFDHLGRALADVGDLDGDGVRDLLVGAPGEVEFGFGTRHGYAQVHSGVDGSLIIRVEEPDESTTNFGHWVIGGGDLNGDGVPDLLVSAPRFVGSLGALHVLSGRTGAELWRIQSDPNDPNSTAGFSAAIIDDVNGDGIEDLISMDSNGGIELNGRATIFAGAYGDAIPFCDPLPNSTGVGATLRTEGPISVRRNSLAFVIKQGVPDQLTVLFYGLGSDPMPAGDGLLCVDPDPYGFVRIMPATTLDDQGVGRHEIDFLEGPLAVQPLAWRMGRTWMVQAMLRDPAGPGGTGVNFTNALEITFTP